MSFRTGSFYSDFGSRIQLRGVVKTLIAINIAVFIIIHIFKSIPWFSIFGLVPALVLSRLMIWQLLTYLFLHFDLWHLVLNMLMLWMFGEVIENSWGSKRFLSYYFFTGAGAGLCSVIFAFNSNVPVMGASGAIFGLLVAYAMMFPDSVILLFLIFPMKMKYAAMVLAGINLLGAMSNPGAGIAYIAHLGGGLFGYLYLKNEKIRLMLSRYSPESIKNLLNMKQAKKKQEREENIDEQIDRILDKISAQGVKSLTKQDREILKQKRKEP
ncbi:MAG: rhomboid family intramembrane serine protease [Candidatus Omnitrophica bacterium]|nr:rhomboid family intramembrane serine protease [Candidatus Omnitrophota bacterium]